MPTGIPQQFCLYFQQGFLLEFPLRTPAGFPLGIPRMVLHRFSQFQEFLVGFIQELITQGLPLDILAGIPPIIHEAILL